LDRDIFAHYVGLMLGLGLDLGLELSGLGLGLGPLASASDLWPRPQDVWPR